MSTEIEVISCSARREANTEIRNCIKRYEQELVNKLSQDHLDVKTFWKLSKNILGCKSDRTIPPLYENGQILPDDLSKATIFMPPSLEKLKRHIAFSLSVRASITKFIKIQF